MKAILGSVLKKKVTKIITELGIGVLEIIIDLPISFMVFNSIEYNKSSKKIMLHYWIDDELEMTYDFDELENEDKLEILRILSDFL